MAEEPPLMALSEQEEIQLGRTEHRKIVAQFGIYRDDNLQSYITKIGERIASHSSRSELPYHFTILDDPMVNAFALPGGYIYVTRGMLAHMNSESELAAVLGHEIAHVTEKHAERSMNRGKIMKGISTVAAIATGTAAVYDLGNMFGGVLLKGYSRAFELEADKVGAKYMAKAGYNPEAMLSTIEVLKAKDRIEIAQARLEKREPRIYHGILSTHPDHDTRYKKAIRASAELNRVYTEFIQTDEFLEKLNGLSYGPSRQIGVVRKNRFYHPRLGIKLTFPVGWRIENSSKGVLAYSLDGGAVFQITSKPLYKRLSPEKYLRERLGYELREGRDFSVAGLPGYIAIADRAKSPYGPRPVRLAILYDNRKRQAYLLTGAGKHDLRKIKNDKQFITTIFSLDRMDKDDYRDATVPKIQVVRAERDTTMESLAEQSPLTNYALDQLRVINGLYPNGQPEEGQLIKIID
ncbi:MAG: M48 family metalloprotease [Gammaproteobacteria bacterium]|nr:M48 family metalloprotease [Gammaproteobacteria bacterium]